MSYALSELESIVSRLIRRGVIAQLDDQTGLVTVTIGDDTSGGLQWLTTRAGPDAEWWAPEEGEQCLVFCPFGDLAQAVVMPALYQDLFPEPAKSRDQHVRTYKDGALFKYDRAAHTYLVDVPDGGSITLKVGNTSLVMQSGGTVLTTPRLTHDGDTADFKGMATVEKLLSFLNGLAGQQGTATSAAAIKGGLTVTGGDIVVDGIGVKGHHHTEHDGPPTSAAVA